MVSINELIIDSKNSENTYELSDNLYIFFFSMIDSMVCTLIITMNDIYS